MCDEHTLQDTLEYQLRSGLSRRQFGALTLGAGLTSMMLPIARGDELPVTESEVDIHTPDGTADGYFVAASKGAHPGVLMWPDIFGLRPAFRQMAKRLAGSGYSVLVVNPYYRKQRAPVVPEHADFDDPPTREALMSLRNSLTPATTQTDAVAFVEWLDRQPVVDRHKRMGTMGYCMTGPFTLRTAAAMPQRIGAGASFHGGGLVTDGPDSPHLLIPKIKAHFLIAIAESDDKREPATKEVLRQAFAKANLPAEIEVYPGTIHGWCPIDAKVYNHEQAERAWSRMLVLFKSALV
ncbi:MAG: dienelactone hydrolase family protein [Gammaproteobacteria bacterium]|nr:dienelactone hydrolase family protein [Gammaproteobacteria bacterium]